MFRLLQWFIGLALLMGVGEVGVHAVMDMANKAANAQAHDQISYSKWNAMLWTGKGLNSKKHH